jgi:hypothetical protein
MRLYSVKKSKPTDLQSFVLVHMVTSLARAPESRVSAAAATAKNNEAFDTPITFDALSMITTRVATCSSGTSSLPSHEPAASKEAQDSSS